MNIEIVYIVPYWYEMKVLYFYLFYVPEAHIMYFYGVVDF